MKLLKFALALAAVILTRGAGVDRHPWIAPKATDLRSPCPGLNTLANHGYLPRDGRDISIPMMLSAAIEAFNVAPDAILQAAKFGLLSGDAPTTLDLDALSLHNLIEHDASLSRGDFALGDNLHFNETIFSTLANANAGVDYYDPPTSGSLSLATNPNITNTGRSVMGNPLTGVAPKKLVHIFFREERLPIAEGWERSKTPITAESLDPIQNTIFFFVELDGEPGVRGPPYPDAR
ncbi:Cloroperoxidase [Mycena filopes]|nr:Cloroperoxidase [Mycena filopes]